MCQVQCSMHMKVRLNGGWTRVPIIHGWRERRFNKDAVSCASISPYFSFYLSFSDFFPAKKNGSNQHIEPFVSNFIAKCLCTTRTSADDHKKVTTSPNQQQNHVHFEYVRSESECLWCENCYALPPVMNISNMLY